MQTRELILLISIVILTTISLVGIFLVRKKYEKTIKEVSLYNPSSNTYSYKGFIWNLNSVRRKIKYNVISLELSYGDNVDEIALSKDIDDYNKKIVKAIKTEFNKSIVGLVGQNNFLIAVEEDDEIILKKKMEDIQRIIIGMNSRFNKIIVTYGFCLDNSIKTNIAIMVERANYAIRYAKIKNTNAVVFNQEVSQMKDRFAKIEKDLNAIDEQFDIEIQPIIKALDGKISGCEAKLIWKDKDNILYREEFYNEFIRLGLSDKIDLYAIKKACEFAQELKKNGIKKAGVSVCVNSINLLQEEFVKQIKEILSKYDIYSDSIVFSMDNIGEVYKTNNIDKFNYQIRELSVNAEVKDFGKEGISQLLFNSACYSCKLDPIFVKTQLRGEKDYNILKGIINLIEDTNNIVVIDGINSSNTISLSREISKKVLLQGNFLCKNISKNDFIISYNSEKTFIDSEYLSDSVNLKEKEFPKQKNNLKTINDKKEKNNEVSNVDSLLSSNNFLKELRINGELINGFNKKISSYKYNVDSNVDIINIEAIAEDDKAAISGNGNISISEGVNIINVNVTSEKGDLRTYIIVITKEIKEIISKAQKIEEVEDVDVDEEENNDNDIEEIDVDEDNDKEEEKLAKLMETFKKQFRDQWEQEMLKKYPELMKKHNARRLFSERIVSMSAENKAYYNEIKNSIMEYEGITNATNNHFDTFIFNRKIVCKLAVIGKSIKVYMALDPLKYPNGQFPHKDVSNIKRHEKTPFSMKITSKLAIKRFHILLEDIANINNLTKKSDFISKDYAKGMNFQLKRK